MAKSNKKFENIFDECLENLLNGQESLEQCLQKYPEQAAELEPLLRTALSVNNAVAIQPSPEAKARGRYQLQLKMAQIGKPRRAPLLGWQPRWAVAIMTVLLVFTLSGGTVLAANSSMPGNPLYPVKIATENVRVRIARSEVAREAILATCADRRIAEVVYVVSKGNVDTEKVEAVAARYISQVNQMSGMTAAADQPVMSQGVGMMTATEPAETSQPVAAPQTESTAQPVLGASQKTEASTEKASVQGSSPPQVASAPNDSGKKSAQTAASQQDDQKEQLKVRIIAYGITHPQQLEKMLEDPKVPEQAKLALRRMIQNAREQYPQAVRNLERQQKSQGKNDSKD